MNEGSFAKMSENIVGSIYRELMYATYGTGLAVMELSMLLEEEIYSRSSVSFPNTQRSLWKEEAAVKYYGDLATRVVRNISKVPLSAEEWRRYHVSRDIKSLTDLLCRDSGVGYQQKVYDKKTQHKPLSYAPDYNPLKADGDLPSQATSKFAKQLIAEGKVPIPKVPVAPISGGTGGNINGGTSSSSTFATHTQSQSTSNIATSVGTNVVGGLQRKTSEAVMTVDWGASMASVLGAAASTQQQEWGKAIDAYKTDANHTCPDLSSSSEVKSNINVKEEQKLQES